MDALLLHGLGGGPADMDSLAQELATMGVACHAPCLPGHGTGWEAFVRSHWNQWSAAAHEAYAALAGQNPEPPLLAGYSLGGLLALDTLFWAREAGLPAPRCLLVFAAPLYWSPRPSGRTGPALAAGLESLATACGDLFPAQRGRAGDRALAGTRAGGLLAPYGRDSP